MFSKSHFFQIDKNRKNLQSRLLPIVVTVANRLFATSRAALLLLTIKYQYATHSIAIS